MEITLIAKKSTKKSASAQLLFAMKHYSYFNEDMHF